MNKNNAEHFYKKNLFTHLTHKKLFRNASQNTLKHSFVWAEKL